MKPLLDLINYGQSYWLDNLSRAMIQNGALKARVDEQGLRGVTSNPAIFNKAISGSDAYDGQITELVRQQCSIQDIYEQLVVTDVQSACDTLRPVYDASEGIDGFVSLEVSPYLSHDTEGTKLEARRLFQAVDRPNVMIKIPGTVAGLPAIEEMLYEGINVNITLLFSIARYEAVAQAYIQALERRAAEGKPIHHIASVASFFLSRIDVLVDQLLAHRIRSAARTTDELRAEQLLGKVAIASAKLAYQRFKSLFNSSAWQAMANQSPRLQRPLWASTSTKNPLYSDVYYVEPLIGPHTVNTLPDETVEAFGQHGYIAANSVESDVEQAHQIMHKLTQVGIDLAAVTQQLLDDGVQKFIEPYDLLMRTLAVKRQAILGGIGGSQTMSPGSLKSTQASTAATLDRLHYTRRLWDGDPTLWSNDSAQVAMVHQRLGWLTSPKDFAAKASAITDCANEIKDAGFRQVVLLGMGGSSLCPEVCRKTFGVAPGWLDLTILDNTDPTAIQQLEGSLELPHTVFIVASKSGTTTETLSFYRYFFARVAQQMPDMPGRHFIAITDPGTFLAQEAERRHFRYCWVNPERIGGRYSALSYFGLLPMALLGVDIAALLQRADQIGLSSGPFIPADTNVAVSLGTMLGVAARQGRDKVTFTLSDSILALGDWLEQLLAESTGKDGLGITPIVGEPLASPDAYGQDRVFVSLRTADGKQMEIEDKLDTLAEAGHPVVRIVMHDVLDLGGEFLRWELATATAGVVLGLNPFDEPNVAEGKTNTTELLKEWQQHGRWDEKPVLQEGEVSVFCGLTESSVSNQSYASISNLLATFIDTAAAPDYMALLAYFMRTEERHQAMQKLRLMLRDRRRVATTVGYGPRYLHSTGQLHKGGANSGVFLLLTADTPQDLSIPDASYGFATLQRAQALGDFRSLNARGRRVIRLHLGQDIEGGLQKLIGCLESH
ncbi:MAG: bifunctional transaldolase/phosoglucose isomerase [bacterium]|nr:bifunctional transaldolase/phosoglucose isomerase [bacterium]